MIKNFLLKGRAIFLFLLIAFSVHLGVLIALGWKGWLLYGLVVVLAVASCYVSDGGCARDLCRLLTAIHPRLARIFAALSGVRCGQRHPRAKRPARSPRKG